MYVIVKEVYMKNIVIINGSPKKDSISEKLALKFIKALNLDESNYIYDLIKLVEMDIKNCIGCLKCKETGICFHNDEMNRIKDKIKNADLIVFNSPVHISHITSIFHNFFERSIIDLHTFEYKNKPFVNIVSTNGSGEEEVDKYLSKMGLLFGMIKIGFIYISNNDQFKENTFKKLVKKTRNILEDKIKIKPTFKNKMYFEFMKKTIKENLDYFVYENKVWKERGWL